MDKKRTKDTMDKFYKDGRQLVRGKLANGEEVAIKDGQPIRISPRLLETLYEIESVSKSAHHVLACVLKEDAEWANMGQEQQAEGHTPTESYASALQWFIRRAANIKLDGLGTLGLAHGHMHAERACTYFENLLDDIRVAYQAIDADDVELPQQATGTIDALRVQAMGTHLTATKGLDEVLAAKDGHIVIDESQVEIAHHDFGFGPNSFTLLASYLKLREVLERMMLHAGSALVLGHGHIIEARVHWEYFIAFCKACQGEQNILQGSSITYPEWEMAIAYREPYHLTTK